MANIKIRKWELRDVLAGYSLNFFTYRTINKGIENANILIKTDSDKFVLRIYTKKTIKEIKAEIEVLAHLRLKGISVPEVYSCGRSKIAPFNDKFAVLFSFMPGRHIAWKPINPELAKDIGFNLAEMHRKLMCFTPVHNKTHPYATSFIKFNSINGLNTKILHEEIKVQEEVKNIRVNKLRKGIIHADFSRENLLVGNNKLLSILDFDDFHKDFLVWDVAIAISQLFVTKSFGIDWRGMQYFLKGYESVIKLNKYEKNALLPLLKLRNVKIAIYVKNLIDQSNGNEKQFKSIYSSVLKKLFLIEKNKHELSTLFY